jgi:hypothetical protein
MENTCCKYLISSQSTQPEPLLGPHAQNFAHRGFSVRGGFQERDSANGNMRVSLRWGDVSAPYNPNLEEHRLAVYSIRNVTMCHAVMTRALKVSSPQDQ